MRQSKCTSSEEQNDSRSSQTTASDLETAVLRSIAYVAQYMGDHDDWVDIKIEIMNGVRPELRRRFSRRDQLTREQVPNDFDRAVIIEYSRVSGVDLIIRTLSQRRSMRTGAAEE